MVDVSISLPDASSPSLQESFERLHLRPSPSSIGKGHRKRPSLGYPQSSSSGASSGVTSVKRRAKDAWDGQDHENEDGMEAESSNGSNGKRKLRRNGDGERSSSSNSRSGSSSGEGVDGDLNTSRGSSRKNRTSGSGSGSETHDGGSTSTFATSAFGSPDSNFKPFESIGMATIDGSIPPSASLPMATNDRPSITAPSAQARTTYVNPSPTATSRSWPFVSTNFSAASSSSSYSTNVEQAYLASAGVLQLNTHPDPPPYTLVTFGAGTHSKQLDAATAASQYGAFHVPTSAYPVGAGQFLSGGFGFIGRKHGLAMDNVVEAEMVLADGRIVWVGEGGKYGGEWKEGEDPEEVWWGLRGAGAILGVVTRFRAKGFYLPSVYAGNLI